MTTQDFKNLCFCVGEIQTQHAAWARHNFPDAKPIQAALGVVEELGELAHAHLKRSQGIRGTAAEHEAAAKDAVADALLFLVHLSELLGFDLSDAVASLRYAGAVAVLMPEDSSAGEEILACVWLAGDLGPVGAQRMDIRRDAAEIVIRLERYCSRNGWDLSEILAETWEQVRRRDWVAFPGDGVGR